MLGSPVSCFVSLYNKEQYIRDHLPTCDNFYNIYHPSDLVAYRIEPIIKPHPKHESNNITNTLTSNQESCFEGLKDS